MKFIDVTLVDYQCTDKPIRLYTRMDADKILYMTRVVTSKSDHCDLMPEWTHIYLQNGEICVEECISEIERRISTSE